MTISASTEQLRELLAKVSECVEPDRELDAEIDAACGLHVDHMPLSGPWTQYPEFYAVVMNPPFYGRHYVKHVRHAMKFLKPGGTLVAILPATAHYDHKEVEGEWRDLPVGSFAEAGTNVPTGLLRVRAAS